MDRRISWRTGCFDEIELVYEKAERNENIAALLSEMETMALSEAETGCGMLRVNGEPLTHEMFLAMRDSDKEMVIYHLANIGLQEFVPSMRKPEITVTFSAHIQQVLGCAMFSLLNRLEKLDGAYNETLFPKAVLKLQVPLGGRKGLMKCEMLIMQLYPWLSVSESAIHVSAGGVW